MRIVVNQIKSGKFSKRIKSLETWLKDPIAKSKFDQAKKNMRGKWSRDVQKTFTVRSSKGLSCDRILQKSLGIEVRKTSIIVYVKPIYRGGKTPNFSSGGAVQNLTTILFRGSRASHGMYSYKWDARTQQGMHPGISASPMRNLWTRYKLYAREQIDKKLKEGLEAVRKAA